jgi:hypothetical protein
MIAAPADAYAARFFAAVIRPPLLFRHGEDLLFFKQTWDEERAGSDAPPTLVIANGRPRGRHSAGFLGGFAIRPDFSPIPP